MDLKNKFLKMNLKQLESLKKEYYGNEIKQTVIQKFIDYKSHQLQIVRKKKEAHQLHKKQLKVDAMINELVDDLVDDLINEEKEHKQEDDDFESAKKDIINRKSNSRLACDIDVKNMQKNLSKKTFQPPYEV